MALKDELQAGPPARALPNKIESWRQTLDEETLTAFDAAIRDSRWSDTALAQMLTRSGFKVSDTTVRTYRINIGVR